MLQFGASPVVTSNRFSVNGRQLLSRNREMLGDMRDRGRGIRARSNQALSRRRRNPKHHLGVNSDTAKQRRTRLGDCLDIACLPRRGWSLALDLLAGRHDRDDGRNDGSLGDGRQRTMDRRSLITHYRGSRAFPRTSGFGAKGSFGDGEVG